MWRGWRRRRFLDARERVVFPLRTLTQEENRNEDRVPSLHRSSPRVGCNDVRTGIGCRRSRVRTNVRLPESRRPPTSRRKSSSLPARVRAQMSANSGAYAKNHPTVYVLTLSLADVAPDGSASAQISLASPGLSLEGASAVFAHVNQFFRNVNRRRATDPPLRSEQARMPTASQPSIDDQCQNGKASQMAENHSHVL